MNTGNRQAPAAPANDVAPAVLKPAAPVRPATVAVVGPVSLPELPSSDLVAARVMAVLGSGVGDASDGIARIIEWAVEHPDQVCGDVRQLAYVLATSWHETARTMRPVTESGTDAYLRAKPYWPYIGRGLVQITWRANYARFGVAGAPETALTWPVALRITFEGMSKGMFTGVRLSEYFDATREDPVNARRIINGTDRAELVASYYAAFHRALTAPVVPPVVAAASPQSARLA